MSSKLAVALQERLYGGQIGGTPLFRRLITDRLRKDSYVLDLGCGEGRESADVCSEAAFVVGCDIGEGVGKNSFVSACIRGDAQILPFRDGSFDAVIMDYVVEHLECPNRCAAETFRVLRSGGRLFLRTPNLYHYVSIIGYVMPHGFHRLVANRVRGSTESSDADVFKTFYRANTRRAVERVFGRAGFVPEQIMLVEREPSYMMFSGLAFLLGYCYERLVNTSEALATFRANIFAVLRKPHQCASSG